VPVEADRAQHPHELGIDRLGVQIELVAELRFDQRVQVELAHASFSPFGRARCHAGAAT
jgi:hypothetical protein